MKEETDQRRIFTQTSPGRRQPTGEAVEDLEETASHVLFSENSTRRSFRRNTENPRNTSRYRRMEEEDEFFRNLFEEQGKTSAIRREANHERRERKYRQLRWRDLMREREREHDRSQPGTLTAHAPRKRTHQRQRIRKALFRIRLSIQSSRTSIELIKRKLWNGHQWHPTSKHRAQAYSLTRKDAPSGQSNSPKHTELMTKEIINHSAYDETTNKLDSKLINVTKLFFL